MKISGHIFQLENNIYLFMIYRRRRNILIISKAKTHKEQFSPLFCPQKLTFCQFFSDDNSFSSLLMMIFLTFFYCIYVLIMANVKAQCCCKTGARKERAAIGRYKRKNTAVSEQKRTQCIWKQTKKKKKKGHKNYEYWN